MPGHHALQRQAAGLESDLLELAAGATNSGNRTEAADVEHFCLRVTKRAVDRLEERGGACIVSTHLGKYFARDGRVDPRFDEILRYIAGKRGWLVPVSTLLDHLRENSPAAGGSLGRAALARLELRFLVDQLVSRLTSPGNTYP